jgi:hypothetical protein
LYKPESKRFEIKPGKEKFKKMLDARVCDELDRQKARIVTILEQLQYHYDQSGKSRARKVFGTLGRKFRRGPSAG